MMASCALCRNADGATPTATVRVWVVQSRWQPTILDDRNKVLKPGKECRDRANQLDLCESCRREAEKQGNLLPGAEVVVL